MSGEIVENITFGNKGGLRNKRKIIVPYSDDELKQAILAEAHNSNLPFIQAAPRCTEIYDGLTGGRE